MRHTVRPLATAALTLLAACGSITDPTGPDALARKTPPPPRPARTPVLFVHGWNSSASVWTTMIGRFKNDGWLSWDSRPSRTIPLSRTRPRQVS